MIKLVYSFSILAAYELDNSVLVFFLRRNLQLTLALTFTKCVRFRSLRGWFLDRTENFVDAFFAALIVKDADQVLVALWFNAHLVLLLLLPPLLLPLFHTSLLLGHLAIDLLVLGWFFVQFVQLLLVLINLLLTFFKVLFIFEWSSSPLSALDGFRLSTHLLLYLKVAFTFT